MTFERSFFRDGSMVAALVLTLLALAADRAAHAAQVAGPNAQVESGALRGAARGGLRTFFGIPFAQPPVGALRWAAPRAVQPWSGVRAAVTTASPCVQLPRTGMPLEGSEDCLYLDVYAPARTEPGSRLPVFVYFYGGVMVTGSSQNIDASRLAERENIVVVLPNYRLGVFGFLTLPELDREGARGVSGNWALLDQQLALRWVRDNIAAFGGDPEEVTIGGQSAGAYSVGMHMLSPESHSLFRRGIVMGMPFLDTGSIYDFPGYVTNAWEQRDGPSSYLPLLAGCEGAGDRLGCLRGKSTTEIAAAVAGKPNMRWSPTIDGVLRPDLPPRMVARGDVKPTPLLMGTNHNEGGLNVLRLRRALGRPMTAADYHRELLALEGGQRMLEHAPLTGFPRPEEALATIRSQNVNCRLLRTAAALAGLAPVYAYLFADEDAPSLGYGFPDYKPGSYHAAEIQYVFGSGYPQSARPGPARFSAAQLRLSERIMDYWGTFIRTGAPADEGAWPEFGRTRTVLKLLPGSADRTVSVSEFRETYDCDFWDQFERAR